MQGGIPEKPKKIKSLEYRYDSFENGQVLLQKKKHLPAMGWNSWNAFGSGNTEELTRAMADAMLELGLDRLGYQYLVLDDGCYRSERVDGRLANEPVKFPHGFRALAEELHAKGLKFGMYNDIGTNLCAGARVGTCGYEAADAESYAEWQIDFLKVDNCYYLWDNATFSDAKNAKYVYAPRVKKIRLTGAGTEVELSAVLDGRLTGQGAKKQGDYVTNLGTFDGTGPEPSPVGEQSGELEFSVHLPKAGEYQLFITYATGQEPGVGSWIQGATGKKEQTTVFYDDVLPETEHPEQFRESAPIPVFLQAGDNVLRLMNHRRQENTLDSYATLLEELNRAAPGRDIVFSICEWGKTQPQNWGYKVGDSWRILNDITFRVGSDGDPGMGAWEDSYTPSVTSQYNKAVIMDEFSGLHRGWNDPDMLMVGMNGLTEVMCRTHFTMWCMMNAPLMLGLDLRRVKKGDSIFRIIANEKLIRLNQDPLGVQAKRVFCSLAKEHPDTSYITDNNRVDILAKPLADGGIAVSFLNISGEKKGSYSVSAAELAHALKQKRKGQTAFVCEAYRVEDLWTGECREDRTGLFGATMLEPYDAVTLRITPLPEQP